MAEVRRSGVPVKLESAGDSHIGGRSHNEDTVLLRPDLRLYVVADGAGGQNSGNIASSLATTAIAHFFEQSTPSVGALPSHDDLGLPVGARRLSAAVQEANREIITIAKNSRRHHGMGTTVVAVLFVPEHRAVHVAYVGDSRLYRMRDGRLEQITHDHSLLNDVMELQPQIDNARVRKLPRNVVTRALGMSEGLRVSLRSHELVHGDRYLLCTDGISDVLAKPQLREAVALDASCEDRVGLLIEMALAANATDNIAALMVDVDVPTRRRSRPRMQQYGIAASPRPKGVVPELSRDHVSEGSVPGVVAYADGGPDHENAQPGIQITTHELSVDDLDLSEEEQVAFDEDAAPGFVALDEVHEVNGDEAPPPHFEDAIEEETERQTLTPPDVRLAVHATQTPRDRSQIFEDDDHQPSRTTKPGNPLAPAAVKLSQPAGEGTAGAGRYTYVGARNADRAVAAPPPPSAAAAVRRQSLTAKDGLRRRLSQPRLRKATPAAEQVRSGETVAPPALQDFARLARPPSPPLHVGKPPSSRARDRFAHRATAPATPAARLIDEAAVNAEPPPLDARRTLPAMRTPFETGEFMPDGSVVCHACGSVINSDAELCLYCGAQTGFVEGS